jgi:hypothetical protein
VVVQDTIAYVACFTAGLQVLNVASPDNPQIIGNYPTSDWAWGLDISGSYVYLAAFTQGVRIIDISNPANPQEVAGYTSTDWAQAAEVAGTTLYSFGVRVLDVSQPTLPSEVAHYDVPDGAQGISISGTLAYVAARCCGLQIYEHIPTGIQETEILRSHNRLELVSNPVRWGIVEARLALAQSAVVNFEICDVTGRSVASYPFGRMNSGEHRVNLKVNLLANGVYFCRVTAGEFTETRKMVVVG